MNRRGISAIVATVLVILITVAAVSIIWVGILPMISESLEFSALDGRVSVVSTGGYTLYDADREVAMVQVKREVDEGVMNRIVVSFIVDGNSVSSSVVAPSSGGTKVYSFDLAGYGVPESVEVAPIFASGSKEKVGSVTSKAKISLGAIDSIRGNVYGIGVDAFSEVPTDELISFWTFSGDAEDGWGENDGELVGDAQVVGGELVLDGSGDYVEILDDDSLDIVSFITMGVWAKGDVSNTGTRNIIGKSAADYLDGYELRFAGANFLSSNYGDGVEMHYSQPAYIQDINWHYYVISYDGARKRIYVDGVLFYEDGSDDIFSIDGNSLDLWIGQGRRNVGTWSGWIDDVMIFDRALSTEEVVAIYDVQRKV